MEQLDSVFFTIFHYYKVKYKTKANDIALFYILILQASIILLLGAFCMLFFDGMNVNVIAMSKAWLLYGLIVLALIFRNWIYYTGKKRKVLNTKLNRRIDYTKSNILLLWLTPLLCVIFTFVILQRI